MVTPSVPLGPFSYTAPSDLGTQRDAMLCNELLLRSKVGQTVVRGHWLPPKGFTYGRPYDKRTDTALEALRGWGMSWKTKASEKKLPMGRDFMALNRAAVSAGLVTAPEHYDYRTKHDIRLKPAAVSRFSKQLHFPPGMTFGMPARPSTPIDEVVGHKFQDRWISKLYKQEVAKRLKETQKKTSSLLYDNRATLLRTFQNPVKDKPLWHLPHIVDRAKPHLQTFRSSKTKADSFGHFDSDKICRKGAKGQGVYECAKN